MDFDLIFQITPSPSQKADQISHHGDIIKKKTNKKKAYQVSHAYAGWKKDSGNAFSCLRKSFKCELKIRINTTKLSCKAEEITETRHTECTAFLRVSCNI